MSDPYTLDFGVIGTADLARVGGKCASLGQMTRAGVAVPPGFAVTTDAQAVMLGDHGVRAESERHMAGVDPHDLDSFDRIRNRIRSHKLPEAVSLDPLNGDRTKIVIDASWGLGEMVVSGVVTPDNCTVEKVMEQIIGRVIFDKHVELVGDAALGRAVEREVDEGCRKIQCLSDAGILAVVRLAKRLERQNKCPQDVGWKRVPQDLLLLAIGKDATHPDLVRDHELYGVEIARDILERLRPDGVDIVGGAMFLASSPPRIRQT